MWGTIWGDDGRVHVVPCTDEGRVLPEHTIDERCRCHPVIDKDGLCVHEHIQ